METIISVMRRLIGEPDFYVKLGSSTNYSWDYGAMIEYFFAGLILVIVIASVLKFVVNFNK